MRKFNYKKALAFLFMFFSIFTVALFIFINIENNHTYKTITSHTATVRQVQIDDIGDEISAKIYTNEYVSCFIIDAYVLENIDIADIKELKNGETINFSIDNRNAKHPDSLSMWILTSLSTNSKEIYSLNDYNKYEHKAMLGPKIICIVMSLVYLILSLILFKKSTKKNAEVSSSS